MTGRYRGRPRDDLRVRPGARDDRHLELEDEHLEVVARVAERGTGIVARRNRRSARRSEPFSV